MYYNFITENLKTINSELKTYYKQNEKFYYEMLGRNVHNLMFSNNTWLDMFFNKKL